jgi:major membrane immunogen (membrane-anchored lipoprotein)
MFKRLTATMAVVGAVLLAGCGSSSSSSSTAQSASGTQTASTTANASQNPDAGQTGFEGVPIELGANLALASTTQTGTVSGIKCGPTEQLAYHIHTHLAVYVNGRPRALPGGIGIPGSQVVQSAQGPVAAGGQCIYWLHTHAPDGVIHVESPTQRIYTLGDFFAEWHQPLSGNQVAGATGRVTAFLNGKPWTKSPAAIPLVPHAVIQLNVGLPVAPFHGMSWTGLSL